MLYQNDDMGKDYLKGLKDGLTPRIPPASVGRKATRCRSRPSTSHVVRIKSSNPDVVVFFTTPKFGAQAIEEARRDELEAGHHHLQCQRIHRDRDAARRAGEFAGRDLGRLRQGRRAIRSGRAMPASKGVRRCWPNICRNVNRVISSAMTGYNMATTMVEVLKALRRQI